MLSRWIPTEAQLVRSLGKACMEAGDRLERRGEVHEYTLEEKDDRLTARARFYDQALAYGTYVDLLKSQRIEYFCTCKYQGKMPVCPHASALLLHAVRKEEATVLGEHFATDSQMERVMRHFQRLRMDAPDKDEGMEIRPRIRLVPTFRFDESNREGMSDDDRVFPVVGARIGLEGGKLYNVQSFPSLFKAFDERKKETYGSGLVIAHDADLLDAVSRTFFTALREQSELDASCIRLYGFSASASLSGMGTLRLRGAQFDVLFDCFADQGLIPAREKNHQDTAFGTQMPTLQMEIVHKDGYAELDMHDFSGILFFHTGKYRYMRQQREGIMFVWRVTEAFERTIQPLQVKSDDTSLVIVDEDLPRFVGGVVPAISDYVEVLDPGNVLEEFQPDACTVSFYLDKSGKDGLECIVKFFYGDTDFLLRQATPVGESAERKKVKRNPFFEEKIELLVRQYFSPDPVRPRFMLFGDDRMDSFLVESIDRFREVGTVYVSEALEKRRVSFDKFSLSVSISQGFLNLDFDTSAFPVSELEALYRSLMQKKKYHRLADGRYVELDDGNLKLMAEMVHMIQLTPAELASGKVHVAAYRALYIDCLLQRARGLQLTQEPSFRQLVRRFQTISADDYPVDPAFQGVLRPYQETGYRWLKALESCHFGGILADEMGLGKTLQMIAYLHSCTRSVTGRPSLVICPASLVYNWSDEFARFAPHMHVNLVIGPQQERTRRIREETDTDVFVTSYDLLRRDIVAYQDVAFYACVLDEAQFVKNVNTLASKAVKTLQCSQRFVMTGTPVENRLSEMWNMFDFLMPGYLFSHAHFVERMEKPIMETNDQEAMEQLRRLVRPFILRRLKKDVLTELPPKEEFIRRIEMSEAEEKIYAATVHALRSQLDHEGKGKLDLLTALMRLRQICCDPRLCFENYTGTSSKLDACMELVTSMVENGHQILLFSQYTSMLELIRMRMESVDITCETLEGSTSKERRAELVKAFNHGRFQVFLISLRAGGTGLNLTAADIVIHYDPWWNMAAQNQATDRAHRLGQTERVQVYKLITKNTIEERILELQERKASLLDSVTEAQESGILNMSREELLELLAR